MKQHKTVSKIPVKLEWIKVEYHANENQLKNSEKIAYIGQRLMYSIIKK